MLRTSYLGLAVAIGLATSPAFADKKKKKAAHVHSHGHAKLGVAVDGLKVQLDLEIPADSIFGFEHSPKTDAQRQIVRDGLEALREDAATLFALPADLGCSAARVKVESSLEDSASDPTKKPAKHEAEHADVDAAYTLQCTKTPAGALMKVGLFGKFQRLKEIDVQVVTESGQRAAELTPAKAELKL